VNIPGEVLATLAREHGIDPERPIRILPYEWVTLIGHIAMLDSYKKLQILACQLPSQPIVLAPGHKS
jgi:hypothetical protein